MKGISARHGRVSGRREATRSSVCRIRLLGPALVACALALGLAPAPSVAARLPSGFSESTVASGFALPTAADWAPDGRMFVAEKDGRVRVVAPDGAVRAAPLIDLSGRVNSALDRGLLGLAVDSDFQRNGYLWLLYVHEHDRSQRDGPKAARLSRFTIGPDNSVSQETVVLGTHPGAPCPAPSNTVDCIPADAKMHVIGTVRSDPDGTLWVGTGDARDNSTIDRTYRTYDERSYAGKILHVDRNGRGLRDHPFCRTDTDLTHVCTKVYAKGFRNPFRFSLRPGRGPAVGDVGRYAREELDLVQPGRNYGWPCFEGSGRTSLYQNEPRCKEEYAKSGSEAATPPAWEYDHPKLPDGTRLGGSITGGPVYLGSSYPPEFRGSLVVGDYAQRWLKRLTIREDTVTGVADFASDWRGGVDLMRHPSGDIAAVDIGGSVRRYSFRSGTSANLPPVARATASPTTGAAPLAVAFDGGGSSDPDGDPLSYEWNFGDGTPPVAGRTAQHVYTRAVNHTARLTVRDQKGATANAEVVVMPGNHVPNAVIAAPSDGSTYRPGETISFAGGACDRDEGALPSASLRWSIQQHHLDHLHFEAEGLPGEAGTFVTDGDHGPLESYYTVTLTARDARGAEGSQTITLRPGAPTSARGPVAPPSCSPPVPGGEASRDPSGENPRGLTPVQTRARSRLTGLKLSRRGAAVFLRGRCDRSSSRACRTTARFEALVRTSSRSSAKSRKLKTVVLGRRSFSIAAGKRAAARLRLSRAEARLVARRSIKIRVRLTVDAVGGARMPVSKTFAFRRR